ncbi:MAG: 4Fe-4S binding protein [Clostridia bacterium]|nr:4Fe-4S binding protein [Clostridia bacterium]
MCFIRPSPSARSASALGKLSRFLPTQRRLIQLYAALLYNAHLKGFIKGDIYTGPLKGLCVPGLNCYSCPGAVGACPLGALQNALASTGTRAPYYALGILLLFGLTLGRTICGFLCPMGLLQELLHKIPTPKLKKSRFTRALSWLKYGLLILLVVILPLAYALRSVPLPAFCKYICPAGTLEGAIGLLTHPDHADRLSMLGGLFTWKFVLLVAILTACVFIFRAFCRFLCPLGAIYGLFARVSLLGIRIEPSKCISCGKCVSCCPVDIHEVGDHECIQCGKCKTICPTGAIQWKGPKRRPRWVKAVAWALALCLLCGVFISVNQPEPVLTGPEVGMRCPDYALPLYAGGILQREPGQVTVLNFWATWCGPCVEELPHFAALKKNYPQIQVAAVHSHLVTEDVPAYIAKTGLDLTWALDADGAFITQLGGSTLLPMTVILDEDGVIVYNATGSVNYEQLEALVKPLLN